MNHVCKNCHFLAKQVPPIRTRPHTYSWNQEERENGRPTGDNWSSLCQRGVWDTGVNPELDNALQIVIYKNRKDDCFFIPYQKGMHFNTAKELHKIRYDARYVKRSLQIATIGLYLAALGALLNFFGLTYAKHIALTLLQYLNLTLSILLTLLLSSL